MTRARLAKWEMALGLAGLGTPRQRRAEILRTLRERSAPMLLEEIQRIVVPYAAAEAAGPGGHAAIYSDPISELRAAQGQVLQATSQLAGVVLTRPDAYEVLPRLVLETRDPAADVDDSYEDVSPAAACSGSAAPVPEVPELPAEG